MEPDQHFYVYILYSESFDKFYIGQTNDLAARFSRHEKGYVKSTKRFRPWKMVHSEEYNSRTDSVRREGRLKSWKSKSMIKKLVDTSR